jgi:hypothetical protein
MKTYTDPDGARGALAARNNAAIGPGMSPSVRNGPSLIEMPDVWKQCGSEQRKRA